MKKKLVIAAIAVLILALGTVIYVRAVNKNAPEPVQTPEVESIVEEVIAPQEPEIPVITEEPVEVAPLATIEPEPAPEPPKSPEQQLADTVREHSRVRRWDDRSIKTEEQVMWGSSEIQVACALKHVAVAGFTQENIDRFLEWYLNPVILDAPDKKITAYYQFSGGGTCYRTTSPEPSQ